MSACRTDSGRGAVPELRRGRPRFPLQPVERAAVNRLRASARYAQGWLTTQLTSSVQDVAVSQAFEPPSLAM